VRSLLLDVSPLRHRDFRLLWTGEVLSETGSNIAVVAVLIQVYRLTGSSAATGAIGLAQLPPLMAASLFGGPLIDRYDRRTLMLVSQVGQAAASGLLLAGAIAGSPPLLLVYVGAAAIAGFNGFGLATRTAMTPSLVPPDRLPSALALNQVMWQTALIVGPAVGGLVVGRYGLAWAYAIDVVSFGATIGAVLLMRPRPPVRSALGRVEERESASGWQRFRDGFRYLKGRRVLQATFLVDLVAMVFGMPRAIFPELAATQFGGGGEIVGIMLAAVAVGALVGALTTGWVHRVRHQGAAILLAVALWGAAIVGFGVVDDRLWLACGFLAVAGAADVVSAVFRSTILQQTVPDDLRGRISGIHITVVAGGPRLGDAEAGLVADAFSPRVSAISGGVLCLVGVGVLALAIPEFTRYVSPARPTEDAV
jgi:MFS family permease